MLNSPDIIIIGGGVIGCSCAYFLAVSPQFNGSVCVVEQDPTYQRCSTARSVGGIRQQFSTPENIHMSQFAIEFIHRANSALSIKGEMPNIPFIKNGYLLMATDNGLSNLKQSIAMQHTHGSLTQFLSPNDIERKWPWLRIEGIAGAGFGANQEGWTDPYALMQAFKNKASELGVVFLHDKVINLNVLKGRIGELGLISGRKLSCDTIINAAGPSAHNIAKLANLSIPVAPKKRFVFVFLCRTQLHKCPLTVDPTGFYFRPEGDKFICGKSPVFGQPDNDCLDLTVDHNFFQEHIWPDLANRVPAFEAIKVVNAWAGTYAYNTFDQNVIIGRHPNLKNMLFANGFSGHGLQQSPAIGRAVSELVIHEKFQTIDLTRLGFERIFERNPIKELNVI